LSGADFSQATSCEGVDFAHATMEVVKMERVLASTARFDGARLRGADLYEASLYEASFVAADLSGAKLVGSLAGLASFRDASLVEADFTQASLQGADFSGADVRKAKFSFSDMAGTTFDGAVGLAEAIFADARNLDDTVRYQVITAREAALHSQP